MSLSQVQTDVIKRCQRSVVFFLRNFSMTKHPSAGIIPFNPFKYQVKALRAFRANRFSIFRKCRQCFVGDSMVWGPHGPKRIDEIKPGDIVYSYDCQNHTIVPVPVQEVFDNGEREVCEVETKTGHKSSATLDHRYFTADGGEVEAENLTTMDRILEVNDLERSGNDAEAILLRYGEIKRVVCDGRKERVYDIRVPPHNNYVINGAVVHNSGASSISGAFALWFAMFHGNKTILVVSRTDEDAKSFLRENIKFIHDNLPSWMQQLWKPTKINEHEIIFPNGSHIRSLTSHPDVLRSNASSLNIIDEAAFIQDMSVMWAAGFSTLQHGGSVIVVSTTSGVGNWYWNTWVDAEAGLNPFVPIMINWWDMDWQIEYHDALTNEYKMIAPTDGIRKCKTAAEINKYGPYWSPWLEEQWRGLQERGESWKFDQEVLAKFVGSGNTVLNDLVIAHMQTTISDDYKRVIGKQPYVHPVKGESDFVDFNGGDRELEADEGFWVWEKPNKGENPIYEDGTIISPGRPAHRYVMGVDLATGKGRDYNAIELFDIDTQEQVAEMMIRCIPRVFKYIVDYIGRWYNNALAVVERNNGGDAFIDELRMDLMYPNLWRKKTINDKPTSTERKNKLKIAEYGFSTSMASKPTLNKALIDYLRDDDGITIYSRRLLKQCNIYVRKKDRTGRDTNKTEAESGPGNYDDLVIAAGLAFIGYSDAAVTDSGGLIPFHSNPETSMPIEKSPIEAANDLAKVSCGVDPSFLMPFSGITDVPKDESIAAEMNNFIKQLGASPIASEITVTSHKGHTFK